MSLAASASASDLMICAFFNSSSLNTINFCISASCCWTALRSIALEYSELNPRCMKLTSSTITLNSCALPNKLLLISLLMVSLDLRSWSASSTLKISNIAQRWFSIFPAQWSWKLSSRSPFPKADEYLVASRRLAAGGYGGKCWRSGDLWYQ